MKRPLMRLAMTVPLSLLLALLLTVSFYSCSKPDLADIIREHIEAVNNDDVEKNLTFFTDDIVFVTEQDRKLTGKDQLRNLMEWDVEKKARLTIKDIKVEGNSVTAMLTEKNEADRLVGIEEYPFKAIYNFRGRLIEKVELESSPEAKVLDQKYKPFEEWVSQEHPQEFSKLWSGLTAEQARLLLSLLKEWRDKTQMPSQTETESVEQELIKLENESNDAWLRRDVEAYARLLADDYLETGPDGDMATKAEELALVRSTETTITAVITDDFKVRVYGDAAVVTFRLTFKKPVDGKEITGQERFTDTWIRRDGRWQCVAVHYSRIAQK